MRADRGSLIWFVMLVCVVLYASTVVAQEGAFMYDDHGNRDPFWPLVSDNGSIISYETEFTITDLVLEGIMAGQGGQHVAIINGRIVTTGDQLGNFTILEVHPEAVIIKKDNLKFELKLEKED